MPKLGHEDDEDQGETTQQVEDPNDDTDPEQQVQLEDPTVPAVLEDDGQQDERLSDQAEDDDADTDREPSRKRESAKERRQRAKEAKERDKLELQILRDTVSRQNASIEAIRRDTTVNRVTELDNRLATALAEVQQFENIEAAAITAKNGQDAVQAKRLAEAARQRAWGAHNEKEALVKQAQTPAATTIKPYADKAVNFLKDKPWYNPNTTSATDLEDTMVVEALDKVLSKQMDPNDPLYWSTLENKVRTKLPHRFESQTDDSGEDDSNDEPQTRQQAAPRRKGPPTGGSSRTQSGRGPQEIRLPKEMVEAMKEAGHWDNPKVRARVAQRYIDGLRQNRNG
jgi:hypothetical protein